MKAATLNGKQAVTSNHKLDGQSDWIVLIERLWRFFDGSYESDWEEKTGLPWREWGEISLSRGTGHKRYSVKPLRKGGNTVKESILNGKRILVVVDKPDVLEVLKKEISEACSGCKFETATTYQEAVQKMISWSYDAVILDGMGIRGSDLLDLAVMRNFPIAMLSTPTLNPQLLNQAIKKGARACLPNEKLGGIVPFLEHFMRYTYSPLWGRLSENLRSLFNAR